MCRFEFSHTEHGRWDVRSEHQCERASGQIEHEKELSDKSLDDVHILTLGNVQDDHHVSSVESWANRENKDRENGKLTDKELAGSSNPSQTLTLVILTQAFAWRAISTNQ